MAQCREVAGLRFAERCARPTKIPLVRRVRGSKRYGIRYESAVAKATGGMQGLWWAYLDANGRGYCQTDIVLAYSGEVFVLECKLTEVDDAWRQLASLYIPVVSLALKHPAKGIIVARHLSKRSDRSAVCTRLEDAMAEAQSSYFPTLHWIERGPI
jgi:hypothetical protein